MKSRSLSYFLPVLLLMSMLMACSKTPRGVLNQEKMAHLLADVYTGESVIEYNRNVYNDDSMKKVMKQSVLAQYQLTDEEFDSTMSWYGHHIEEYIKACDRAVEILEKRVEAIPNDPDAPNVMMVYGDTAQVWPLSPYYHINASTPVRFITFRLTPDDNWEPGDEYTFSFKAYNGHSPVNSLVAVDYKDGGTTYQHYTQNGEGKASMVLKLDSTRTASSVYGYITAMPLPTENIYLDSISLVRTRVNPHGYYSMKRQPRFDRGIDSLTSK